MMRLVASALILVGMSAGAQGLPAAVVSDPVVDATHPPRMEPVRIPVGGVLINGVLYVAGGAGSHPTVAFFHGMPGNEQNLDLAQAMRRAGWNVLTMHYRGAWGSPGIYSYQHQLEDGRAAVAFLRAPRNVALYGIDVRRIVVGGHSTGGFVAANVAATTPGIAGLMLISGTDDAGEALVARKSSAAWAKFLVEGFDGLYPLVGCTAKGLADELLRHPEWSFAAEAPKLTKMPVLVVTAEDGFAAEADALADAVPGSAKVHFAADHAYSAYRLALAGVVVGWLGER